MPPKRARDEADDATAQELQRTAAELSRHKSAIDEAFAELLCPITQSLPVDTAFRMPASRVCARVGASDRIGARAKGENFYMLDPDHRFYGNVKYASEHRYKGVKL